VVNTEYCSIHPSSDDTPAPYASLWDKDDIANRAAMTQAVHRYGALAGVELWLGGWRSGNVFTLARELVEKAAPVPDIVQWFGEWARDVRGEQRGLFLMTAHRAKGLEFDHVAILNGGWDRPSRGEDADAPRRLFYVAMTRARSTLTVLTDGPHAFVRQDDAVLSRRVTPDTATLPHVRLRYIPPDPKLVDLSFAGRLRPGDPSLAAIAAARPGDPVHLIRDGDRWRIDNAQGQTLARLSRAFAPPEGTTFLRGEVAAILNWRREDGDEEYNHLLRRDAWEVVLPELVFEAGAQAVMADQNGS
jgi:ATP-dependent DNA helicase RecQ